MTQFKPNLALSPAATRDACQSAIDELQDADKKAAKEVLKGRLKEVERLRTLLVKAEGDLAKLLEKDVSEIAALQQSSGKVDGWISFKEIIPTQAW